MIITEADNVWQGAVDYPKFTESSKKRAMVHSNGESMLVDDIIEWDITIYFLVTLLPPVALYTPDLRVYPNIAL